MSLFRIDVNTPVAKEVVDSFLRLTTNGVRGSLVRIAQFIEAFSQGTTNWTTVKVATGAVAAAGTATFTGRPTANDTITILNTVLTAKDSGANGTTQFNTSASVVATTAANLAACINANTTLNKQVIATSALGVVTITALVAGVAGNGFQYSESLDNTTIVAFAGGAENLIVTLSA